MTKKTETGPPTDAEESLESAREKFSEVVESKIRGIKGGAKKATRTVKVKAEQVSAEARDKYEGARESARQGYETVTTNLDQLGEDVKEYVQHNPGKSIAVAIGTGFLLGILLRGRRD